MKLSFKTIIYSFAIFANTLLCYRMIKSGNISYIFLPWNLFLAFIPYWISSYLAFKEQFKISHLPLFLLWILFLPNAPYILTDLFHLKIRPGIPVWYDLILVCSFALIGLLLFYRSTTDMINSLKEHIRESYFKFILPAFFWLMAFGLYLGRYLRFNSWNVVNHPFRLMHQSFDSLFYKDTLGFTLIFGAFMWFVYLTLVNFNSKEKT
jgi:uncharacterized membrane protein